VRASFPLCRPPHKGKKVSGRKRHIIVDTLGLLLVVSVTAASVQDRDGAQVALELAHGWYRRLVHVSPTGPTRDGSSSGPAPSARSR
jgi:hypothetical protein